MDASKLIGDGCFYYENCIFSEGDAIIQFKIVDNHIEKTDQPIDEEDITDLGVNFVLTVDTCRYVCGEGIVHSSSGFFYKEQDNKIKWVLFCKTSDPFVSISKQNNNVIFLSQSGEKWEVHNDEIENLKIHREFTKGDF